MINKVKEIIKEAVYQIKHYYREKTASPPCKTCAVPPQPVVEEAPQRETMPPPTSEVDPVEEIIKTYTYN